MLSDACMQRICGVRRKLELLAKAPREYQENRKRRIKITELRKNLEQTIKELVKSLLISLFYLILPILSEFF